MTQTVNYPIFPTTTDGTELSVILNDANNSYLSCNSGTTRPSYAIEGTMWLNTTNAASRVLNLFDGTVDIVIATIDDSGGITFPLESKFADYYPLTGGPVYGDITISSATATFNARPTNDSGTPGFNISDANGDSRGKFFFDFSSQELKLEALNDSGVKLTDFTFKSDGSVMLDGSLETIDVTVVGVADFVGAELDVEGAQLNLFHYNDRVNKGVLDINYPDKQVRIINNLNPAQGSSFLFMPLGIIKTFGDNTTPYADEDLTNKLFVDTQVAAATANVVNQIDSVQSDLIDTINDIRLTARCKFSGFITGPVAPADGFNIDTVVKISVGLYEVIFSEEMVDKDYSIHVDAKRLITDTVSACFANVDKNTTPSKTKFRVQISDEVGLPLTPDSIYINISGGK